MTNTPEATKHKVSKLPDKNQAVTALAVRKTGRPTTYTPAVASAICEKLADGMSLRKLCAQPAMPSMTTVLRWLVDETKPEFRLHYAHAREAQADLLAGEILEIADDSSGDTFTDKDGNTRLDREFVARARLRVDSRKWLASKLAPKKYGDRIEHAGTDGGAIQHAVSVRFV
ncbi:MAG: hypothetical protein Q8R10_05895 [Pseudomonas sp.]|uniref:terminase small subunit-like protein n=1 Tax=Pseudomonas sp. TaxID=306 RepID=UPI002734BE32|nr:hypothetical protein [Pseudomonas sp.]MDP3845942.1 hypothetical protein [Pseudomonas sp.]